MGDPNNAPNTGAIADNLSGLDQMNAAQAQKTTAQEATGFANTVAGAMGKVKDANSGLSAIIGQATEQTKETYQDIFKSLHNKERIAALPEIVTNIWGMFDHDMNEGVQDAKVKSDAAKINLINTQVDQAAKARDAVVKDAEAEVNIGQARLEAAKTVLSSLATVQNIKEGDARIKQITANTQQIMQTMEHNRETYLAHQYTPAQLQNASEGKDPKLSAGLAQDVLLQKTALQDQVATAGLALKANKLKYAEEVRTNILMKGMDFAGDLVPISEKMNKDKLETMDFTDPRTGEKVTFTRGEVNSAVAARYKNFIDQQNQQAESVASRTVLIDKAGQLDARANNLAAVSGGQLDEATTATLNSFKKEIGVKARLEGFETAQKSVDNALKFIDEKKKALVDAAHPLEKPAISQLIETGKLNNKAAFDYAFANAQNNSSQAGTNFEGFEYAFGRALTDRMTTLGDRLAKNGTGKLGGNTNLADLFASDDKEKNRTEIMAKLLDPSTDVRIVDPSTGKATPVKLVDMWRNSVAEDYTASVLQKLVKQVPPGASPLEKYLAPSGKIAPAFKQTDGTFNIGLLAKDLEAQTQQMQADGRMPKTESLAATVYQALQTYQDDYSKQFTKGADINRRVYNQIINSDKPLAYFETAQLKRFEAGLKAFAVDASKRAPIGSVAEQPGPTDATGMPTQPGGMPYWLNGP